MSELTESILHKIIEGTGFDLCKYSNGQWWLDINYDGMPFELTDEEGEYLDAIVAPERERQAQENREGVRKMRIDQARSNVEYAAKQLANAMDAADRMAKKVEQARAEALATVESQRNAQLEVAKLTAEFNAAEAALRDAQVGLASTNGEAGGAAFNATIRTDPNPEPT